MTNKHPKVSVLMPVYNSEKYLPRAIDSILGQKFKDFELILIDDKSTDMSLSIMTAYAKKDKRIRIIRNNKNIHIAKSLNKGLKVARADIIARMDSDDQSLPERLEKQYEVLSKHPKVAIVGANMIIIDENGNKVSKREYPTESEDLKRVMFRYSPFSHPVVMYRKKVIMDFGGYNTKMVPCEDIDLWFKVGSKYDFASIDTPLLVYTLIPYSASHGNLIQLEILGLKIKLNAIKKYGYKLTFFDFTYNLMEYLTLWLTPPIVRIYLYNFLRSNKFI